MFGFQESSNINLKEGVNAGLTINTFFEFQEGQYGPQVYFEFGAGELSVKHWVAPPSREKQDGTPNEYYDKQFKQFNETLTQFITGFYSPSEKDVVAAKINAAAEGVTSLQQYCQNVVATCLPADYKTRECAVVMHYKNSEAQYLSVAKKASLNNGRIFAAHPERTLELSEWFKSNCIGLKASASAPDATAAPTPSNINWG